MKKILLVVSTITFVSVLLVAACSASQASEPIVNGESPMPDKKKPESPQPAVSDRADLADLGKAPELKNEFWLNTEQSLRLADLGGKVVLLDMWTFG